MNINGKTVQSSDLSSWGLEMTFTDGSQLSVYIEQEFDEHVLEYKFVDERPMNLIIAGGRDFNDYDKLKLVVDELMDGQSFNIIHGGAKGADALADQYAKEKSIPHQVFKADWNTHGKAAGPLRNKEMARHGDMLIAFWDGSSRGTANMIKQAKTAGLQVLVISY